MALTPLVCDGHHILYNGPPVLGVKQLWVHENREQRCIMRSVKQQSFVKRQFDQSIQQTVHVELIDSVGALKSTDWHQRRQNKAPGEGGLFSPQRRV